MNLLQGTSEARRVLLIGRPGCGKSMLLNKITLDWTDTILSQEKSGNTSEEISFTSKFDFLIYIDLSKSGPSDTITDYLKLETNNEEFLNYLKEESSKCLFILDSWDEFSRKEKGQIEKLAKGDLFQESAMIIASKFMEKNLLPDYKDKTCIIQGFSEKQAKMFVQKLFDNDNVLATLGFDIFSDPFMLHAACFLFKNDIPVTVSLSRFFVEMLIFILKYANRRKDTSPSVSLDACKADLLSVGKLALFGLTKATNIKRVFTENEANEIESGVVTKGCHLGLLHRVFENNRHNPVQVTFPHRIVQEFLAAIYVANQKEGFEILDKYISSLVIVHDLQMLITFICGLSNETGHYFINKVKEISQNMETLGNECPDFCWAGWINIEHQWDQLYARKADNITPFVLKCLWEMSNKQDTFFPFMINSTSPILPVLLQPDLNCKIVSLKKVQQLVQRGKVKFDKCNVVRLYNITYDESIMEDSTDLFNFLPQGMTHILDVQNLRSKCRQDSLVRWLENQKQLFKFYMTHVAMPQNDMRAVLKTIRIHLNKNLRTLFLREVDLAGTEKELCETILQLHSLYFFCLQNPIISESYAANICEVLSDKEKSPQLERLAIIGTNLSSAEDKLGKMIACQRQLKELKLDDTKMTEAQAQEVCSLLSGKTSIISLG